MKILITGGAGYIGTELTQWLAELKEVKEIVIYDNFSRKNYNLFFTIKFPNSEKIRLVKGDILDSRLLEKELNNTDVVYHLAAKVSSLFANISSQEYEQINTWGTADLVYWAEKCKVKRFIHISTLGVYGSSNKPLGVKASLLPKTYYSISKMKGEKYAENLLSNSEMDCYILRLGNVYGYSTSMRFDSVINKYMFESRYYNKIKVVGDGSQMRSFIHVKEVAKVLTGLLQSDLKNDIYNLTQSNYSLNELVDFVQEINPDLEIVYVDQHLKMRNLEVQKDERLKDFQFSDIDFLEDLVNIQSHFL